MKPTHNVNDNVSNESEYNDIDNVREVKSLIYQQVVKNLSEPKLTRVQDFLFRGYAYDSDKELLNQALKQIEKFVAMWYSEIYESDRNVIASMNLAFDGDNSLRPYKEYTESPLWKYTSTVIKATRRFTCERCKEVCTPTHLVAHHKSYKHLGSELGHLEDMELLCTDCHLKEHGIERRAK